MSKEKITAFTPYIFPIVLAIFLLSLSATRISGSSIGWYNLHFQGDEIEDPNLLFGEVRAIRSDEWLVQTPWILSQVNNNFTSINTTFGSGLEASLMGVPVKNWTGIFRPQFWTFFLLPVEQAFSIYWWFKSVILLIGLYWVAMRLSKNNIGFSILISATFLFSPFFQWWYSTSAIDLAAYGLLIFSSLITVFEAQTRKKVILGALGTVFFSICFALFLYPAFQIPIILIVIFLVLGYGLENKFYEKTKSKIIPIILISLTILGLLYVFFISFQPAIQLIQSTEYPGNRISTGGGMKWVNLVDGVYNLQFLKNNIELIPYMGNVCEGSSFVFISIFCLPILIFTEVQRVRENKGIDWLFISLIVGEVFLLAWCVIGFPSILAKITLLNQVPPRRALIGLGFVNILTIVRYLTNGYQSKDNYIKNLYLFTAILVFIFFVWYGLNLSQNNPSFIQSWVKIISLSIIVGLLVFFLLMKNKIVFSTIFLLFSISSSFSVNPLYRGLSPLIDTDFSKEISLIENEKKERKWISFNSSYISNYVAANGGHVYNGTFFYPDLKTMKKLDTENDDLNIYNRYSHVVFSNASEHTKNVVFTLNSPDSFTISISPCNPLIDSLNINTFVFTKPVQYSCLKPISVIDNKNNDLFLYERINIQENNEQK